MKLIQLNLMRLISLLVVLCMTWNIGYGQIIVEIDDINSAFSQSHFDGIETPLNLEGKVGCLELTPNPFHTILKVGVCMGTEVFSIVISDSEGTVWLESSVGNLPASFEVEEMPDGEFLVELSTSEGYLSDWALKQTP